MTINNLFSAPQYVFFAGKFCVLLEFMEAVTESLDSGEDVDVTYLDFCKAFDKVPYGRLLKKVYNY